MEKNLLIHTQDCARVEKEHHVYFVSGTDSTISGYLMGDRKGFDKGNFKFPEEILADSEYNLICRYNYLVAKEKLNYYANFFDTALSAGEECNELEYVGEGYQLQLEHFFFYSLSLLQCAFLNPEELSKALIKIEPKIQGTKKVIQIQIGQLSA